MTITLITGADAGIGDETARQLTALGHTVYLGVRSVARGERAAAAPGAPIVPVANAGSAPATA